MLFTCFLACALAAFIYFVSQGWIEFGVFAGIYKRVNRNKIDDSSQLNKPEYNQDALKRAMEEDNRRKEEAIARRSSITRLSTINRGVVAGIFRGSNMSYSRHSSASNHTTNHYPSFSRSQLAYSIQSHPNSTMKESAAPSAGASRSKNVSVGDNDSAQDNPMHS